MAWHIFIYHRLYIHMYEGFIMIISYDDARERERINQKTRESHVRTAFCGDITQICSWSTLTQAESYRRPERWSF